MTRLLLLITTTAIFAIGLIMIFSTTSAEVLDLDLDKSPRQAFFKQLYYAFAGIFLAWCVYRQGYLKLLRSSPGLLLLFTFFLALALIPGIGKEVNGSRRWLGVGGFTFQPSEFVKYLVPAYFIHIFLKDKSTSVSFKTFLKWVGLSGIPILLILIEPNNGTAVVISMSLIVLFILLRIPFKYWAVPLLCLAFAGGIFAYHLPYVSARLKVYLHPELDLKGKGHQPYQAKIAAGSGQLWGKGPGNSLQKLSYLPEAQNDYIAAIYAEEFGFAGILALIFLYMTVASLGFHIASGSQERGGFYFAAVITFLIGFQAFLNLGVVSGLVPSTGLNLPGFSQGGSSLMANTMGIGILLSIEQTSKKRAASRGSSNFSYI